MHGTTIITRRALVTLTTGLATLASTARAASGKGTTQAAQQDHAATGKEEPMRPVTFDLHCDTIDNLAMVSHHPYSTFDDVCHGDIARNNCQVSLDRVGNMSWVQCYAIWLPDHEGDLASDIDHITWYREAVAWFKDQMAKHADTVAQAKSAAEIEQILKAGKTCAILTVENAACLDAGLGVVDEFKRDGVLIAGLTWNGQNVLGSGNDHPEVGLTDLGRRYVAALEAAHIAVDVSHLNDRGFWEVDQIAQQPYLATHSNARAVCNHIRNLTDDQFRSIARRGGVVGLNFNDGFVRDGGHLYTFDELAAHVEHWLELGGEDAIALGADRDGAEVPTWLADCSSQTYLLERFRERLGDEVTSKLFFENALNYLKRIG